MKLQLNRMFGVSKIDPRSCAGVDDTNHIFRRQLSAGMRLCEYMNRKSGMVTVDRVLDTTASKMRLFSNSTQSNKLS